MATTALRIVDGRRPDGQWVIHRTSGGPRAVVIGRIVWGAWRYSADFGLTWHATRLAAYDAARAAGTLDLA